MSSAHQKRNPKRSHLNDLTADIERTNAGQTEDETAPPLEPRKPYTKRLRPDRRGANEGDEERLLAELFAVYDEAAVLLADWTCPASTECCRFGITGREPYVTSIELLAVKRELGRIGGPHALRHAGPLALTTEPNPSDKKRRLSLSKEERICPLLNAEGRCSVYAGRPLGCRTFFCERASSSSRARSTRGRVLPQHELNALVQRIRGIASRHTPSGDLGRALSNALVSILGNK